MTERDLLEAAALAIGLYPTSNTEGEQAWTRNKDLRGFRVCPCIDECFAWNPLSDDGDAFRLAVELGIEVCPDARNGKTYARVYAEGDRDPIFQIIVEHEDNHDAATRRAVVIAAAWDKVLPEK